MGFFSPHKRHANQFSYIPRYYDPEKEAREQRRAELRGERSDDTSEYTPGKYIRAQSEAREQRRAQRKSSSVGGSKTNLISLVLIVLLVFACAYIVVPRLAAVFHMANTTPVPVEQTKEEFDPYAPFVIVPNDYVEGEELEIVE